MNGKPSVLPLDSGSGPIGPARNDEIWPQFAPSLAAGDPLALAGMPPIG